MTWVFGAATKFIGTAICVADIQVTVGKASFDCLRKLYVIDQNVIAGFAGNVEAGFTMLIQLQSLIDDEKRTSGSPVDMQRVLARYPTVARSVYAGLDPTKQKGSCAVLIAGASRASEAIYGSLPQVARFAAPE